MAPPVLKQAASPFVRVTATCQSTQPGEFVRTITVASVVTAILMASAPVFAQDKPVEINLGGGVTFPASDLGERFDTGWNGAIGVTFNISRNVGIQAEYMYHRMEGPERTFANLAPTPQSDTVLIESNHQMHTGTFNLVARSSGSGAVNGYVLAGPGIYHRIIQLTTPSVGFVSICDPYWYVCYPGAVEVDQVVGDRSSNDFGVNFGGGVTFGRAAKFYTEFRYHYVWGPDVGPVIPAESDGSTYSTNAQFTSLTFGFRF
jgi:opacity protein-like surface antigen